MDQNLATAFCFDALSFTRTGLRTRKRPVTRPPGAQVHLWTGSLEHAEYNRGDESECNIGGYNAKSADERTCEIHWDSSLVHVVPTNNN